MSETLFDDWLEKAKEAEAEKAREKHPKGQMCRGCVHFLAHGFTDRISYCMISRNLRTSCGFDRTTRTGWCAKWEERK